MTDLIGVDVLEKWYVECKRYNRSIDWPTVWKKVSFADSQQADVFLLATNSNPSPTCENEISNWNLSKRSPKIRIWRGYSFIELLSTKPHIKLGHGLEDSDSAIDKQVLSLTRVILGVVQAANSGLTFGSDHSIALETASVLTELLEQRLSDVETHGRFGSGHMLSKSSMPTLAWLHATGDYSEIEEIAYSSIVTSLVHFSAANSIATVASGPSFEYVLEEPRFCIDAYSPSLTLVLEWACGELDWVAEGAVKGEIRFRN